MQVKKPYYAIILAAVGALATISHAAIPYKINYQGRLTRNGSAVNNETHQMSFKLYDTISGGTLIWTSVDQTVAVNNGVFSVVLDAGSPAALSTATFTASRYLELTIDGSTTLTPRETMSASPYAFVAQSLMSGVAVSVSQITIADGTQGSGKVLTSDTHGLASWQTPASGGDVYKASTQTFSGQNTFLNMLTISTRVVITDGTQGASKVLTSDTHGLASWQTPASGGDVYKASTQTFSGQNTFLNMLTISTRVAITDGTQGASKVLTSDANGLASWQTPASGGDVYKASTQSFTGGNTFASWSVFAGSATFTSSVTIPSGVFSVGAALAISSGAVQLSRNLTQSDDAGVTLAMADSGKTITVNSASDQIIHLPAVDATMIGAWFTIVKLNTGKVTVAAGAGSSIADSGVGGTIYDSSSAETYASITLRLASAAQWVIMGGDGSWTTTN